ASHPRADLPPRSSPSSGTAPPVPPLLCESCVRTSAKPRTSYFPYRSVRCPASAESAKPPDERGTMIDMLTIDPHLLLDLHAFVTTFPKPLGETSSFADLAARLALDAPAPLHSDDAVRESVRALLRHGGFKPTGRSKPASEYLLKAVRDGLLSSINL